MKISKIKLADYYDLKTEAFLNIIQPTELLDRGTLENLPVLLICPGGGYGMVSKREGEPVALEFLARGYVTAILNYSTITNEKESHYPMQLHELMAAMDYLANNHAKYGLDPDKIFVMGFSAGGHLACNLGVDYQNHLEQYKIKIKGICLCYPVISSEFGLSGNTYINLLNSYQADEKNALMKTLSFNHANLEEFPPTFIWTTNTDKLVSPLNSVSFVENMIKHQRHCEFHMFPIGPHGLSTCSELINDSIPQLNQVAQWIDMCDRFFKSLL